MGNKIDVPNHQPDGHLKPSLPGGELSRGIVLGQARQAGGSLDPFVPVALLRRPGAYEWLPSGPF